MPMQKQLGGSRTYNTHAHLASEHLLATSASDAFIPALRAAAEILHFSTSSAPAAAAAKRARAAASPMDVSLTPAASVLSAALPTAERQGEGGGPAEAARRALWEEACFVRVLSAAAVDAFERPLVIRNSTGARMRPDMHMPMPASSYLIMSSTPLCTGAACPLWWLRFSRLGMWRHRVLNQLFHSQYSILSPRWIYY